MNTIIPTSFCHCPISKLGTTFSTPRYTQFRTKTIRIQANSNEVDTQTVEERTEEESQNNEASNISTPSSTAPALDKDLKKVGFFLFLHWVNWELPLRISFSTSCLVWLLGFLNNENLNFSIMCFFNWYGPQKGWVPACSLLGHPEITFFKLVWACPVV